MIRELLPIALPIVLSQAVDVLMNFCDRVFLGQIGKEDLAATLSGGILTYMVTQMIAGTLGQINPLVAQNIGAGKKHDAVTIVHQGFFFAIIFTPFVFVASYYLAPKIFTFFQHSEKLLVREVEYFHILSLTMFMVSFRQVFANFFIGIGRTRIVTLSSVSAVAINLPLAYGLIFGKWGFPRLEIRGAAIATVIASAVPVLILIGSFFGATTNREFDTRRAPRMVIAQFKIFLRYGIPAGIERLMNVGGFLFFTMVMYSFSPDVAAATTIVLNWDMVSFLPLIGVSEAASSLVGKYLGARDKELALKSAWAGLKLGWIYSGLVTIIYFAATDALVHVFAGDHLAADFAAVESIAATFLKISCLYFLCDGMYSVLGGILKGAGDTRWTMIISNTLMWSTAGGIYFLKARGVLTPVGGWWALTAMVFTLGLAYFWRFRRKKWLNRLMIAG